MAFSDFDSSPRRQDRRDKHARSHKERHREGSRAAHQWFRCVHCGNAVVPEAHGTDHRNHCNWCLWSKHLDEEPGDRASECHGAMEPIAVWARPGGDWAIIHKCRSCGHLGSNRIAGDDNEVALVSLALRALAKPPFPLARFAAVGERE